MIGTRRGREVDDEKRENHNVRECPFRTRRSRPGRQQGRALGPADILVPAVIRHRPRDATGMRVTPRCPGGAHVARVWNRTWFTPGANGSIQEVFAGALMYDLTDSDGGDAGASEP